MNPTQSNICQDCKRPANLKQGICWLCRKERDKSNRAFSGRGAVGEARRRRAKKVSKADEQ